MAHIDSAASVCTRCWHRSAGTCALLPIKSERMTISRSVADLGGTHLSVAVVQDRSLLAVRDVPVESKLGLEGASSVDRRNDPGIRRQPPRCNLQTASVSRSRCRVSSTSNRLALYPPTINIPMSSRSCMAGATRLSGLPLVIRKRCPRRSARRALLRSRRRLCRCSCCYSRNRNRLALIVNGAPYRTRHVQGGNLGGHIPVSLHGRKDALVHWDAWKPKHHRGASRQSSQSGPESKQQFVPFRIHRFQKSSFGMPTQATP